MNTTQILKKAWNLVWRYRALWLFGSLLAFTVNSTIWWPLAGRDEAVVMQNRLILTDSMIINFPGEGVTIDFRSPGPPSVKVEGLKPGWTQDLVQGLRQDDLRTLLVAIFAVILIWVALRILLRYTSKTALIRMVDEYERKGTMLSLRQGMKLGWSQVAWKLFLIDLAIILPVILALILLFSLVIAPIFLFGLESFSDNAISVVTILIIVVAGFILFGVLVTATALILSISRPVMHQACAVDGLSVMAAIRQGLNLLRTRFDRVIITWLIWIAARLAWSVALIVAMIILLPVLLLTILVGTMAGTLLTLIVFGIASQFVATLSAWVIGIIAAVPIFFFIAFSPLYFLSGLVEVFKSSLWTLSYREFRPLEKPVPEPAEPLRQVRQADAPA